MALFGRETQAEQLRADRIKAWMQARHPKALFSVLFGVIALIDFFTPLALALGPLAVILALLALRDMRNPPAGQSPHLGKRLCITGIILGCAGFTLSVAFIVLVW